MGLWVLVFRFGENNNNIPWFRNRKWYSVRLDSDNVTSPESNRVRGKMMQFSRSSQVRSALDYEKNKFMSVVLAVFYLADLLLQYPLANE